MSHLVQPRLVNDPFGDPGLYLDVRFARRALLFDLGDLAPMAGRELMRVSHVFVSHAHLDHMAGFDRLLRTCLHRTAPLSLTGPPEFVDRIAHRLGGVTWNLLGPSSVDFRLHVFEFDGTRVTRAAEFRAREAFARRDVASPPFDAGVAHEEAGFLIASAALDHGTPSLAFALRERVRVNVRRMALDARGLPVGPWLNDAKAAVRQGRPDGERIAVPGVGEVTLGELREEVLREAPGQAVAYVTDAANTPGNRARIRAVANGVDLLYIEAPFLAADIEAATATRHLTAQAAGEIAREAGARQAVPFHFSGRAAERREDLVREFQAAFGGEDEAGRSGA